MGGGVISHKVIREILPDEVILSRDLKGVRRTDNREQKIPDSPNSEY